MLVQLGVGPLGNHLVGFLMRRLTLYMYFTGCTKRTRLLGRFVVVRRSSGDTCLHTVTRATAA